MPRKKNATQWAQAEIERRAECEKSAREVNKETLLPEPVRLVNGILRIPVNFDEGQIRDSLRRREMVNQFFFECVPSDDLHSILARINKVLPLMKSEYKVLTSDPLIVSTSGILDIPKEQREKLEKDLEVRRVPTTRLPFEAYAGVAPSIKPRSKTARGRGQSPSP